MREERRTASLAAATGPVRWLTRRDPEPGGRPELDALLVRTGGVACGPTAALIHGLELVHDPRQHHVAVPRDSHRRSRPGLRLHRVDLPAREVTTVHGRPATTLERTVLDCLRWLPRPEAVAVGDAALHRRRLTPAAVRGAVAALPPSPTSSAARAAAHLLDARSESVLESLARVLLTEAGLAPPRVQVPVVDHLGQEVARVDLAWPEAGLVVELDGFAFHSERAAVRRDRVRANRLVLLGWRVLRFGWEDVVGRPGDVVATVRQALAEPRVRAPRGGGRGPR